MFLKQNKNILKKVKEEDYNNGFNFNFRLGEEKDRPKKGSLRVAN